MLNFVDIAILAVIALSSLFGIARGLVKEVLSLLVWIAAIVIAYQYSDSLSPMLGSVTSNATAQYALAFAIIVIAVLIGGSIVNAFMSRLVNFAGLQASDRILGAAFGMVRGVVICAIVVYLAARGYSTEPWWQESLTLPYIEGVIDWVQVKSGTQPVSAAT
ncbi:MAG: CvpA family protein [Pseudohongiella nitratireducens]|nr:CvpA family protein [Pseudohongiella nitratireducens]MDF1622424.1 CvpA family protein [Pseudohongiella nitratireducens]